MTIFAVFLIAFVPRLAYFAWASPPMFGDYWDLSTSLMDHGTLALDGVRSAKYEPLYPMFLAAGRWLTGDRAVAIQVLQMAVSSIGGVCLFLTTLALTRNRRTAWLAAALYAVDPLLIRHAAERSDTALLITLLIVFVYAFSRVTTNATIGANVMDMSAAVAGACLGLVVLTRAVALPVVAFAAALLAMRHSTRASACLLLASIAVISPMLVRDYSLQGTLLPTRNGVNLFLGNSEYSSALTPAYGLDALRPYVEGVVARDVPQLPPGTSAFSDAANNALSRLAWIEMQRRPLATLELKLWNTAYFFSPFLVPSHLVTPDTTVALGPGGQATVFNAPLRPFADRLVFSIASCLILVTAAAGVIVRGYRLREDGILWCVLLTFVAVYSLYFPTTRYAAPTAFVLLFYSAIALDCGLTAVTGRPGDEPVPPAALSDSHF